jgi:nucleolar complex protein 3
LNLDLSQFTTHLYKLLPHLAACLVSEEHLDTGQGKAADRAPPLTATLLFRVLNIILLPNYGKVPSYLVAAFSKRLLGLSLQCGPDVTIKILKFIKDLLGRDQKLESMLSTEERIANGLYKDEVDDPQLCNPFAATWWELLVLEKRHYDQSVRDMARELRIWRPS